MPVVNVKLDITQTQKFDLPSGSQPGGYKYKILSVDGSVTLFEAVDASLSHTFSAIDLPDGNYPVSAEYVDAAGVTVTPAVTSSISVVTPVVSVDVPVTVTATLV